MLSTISNINLMRKPVVSGGGGGSAIWMIGASPVAGNINVSTDNGTTWNNYKSNLDRVIGIAYGLNSNNAPLWIASGTVMNKTTFVTTAGVVTSGDSGSTWSNVISLMNERCDCVAYGKNSSGNNLFMSGGYGSTGNIIFSSGDGSTWTGIMSAGFLNYVSGIKYGKLGDGTNIWIAVGIHSSGGAGLAYSINGTDWTNVDVRSYIPTYIIRSITYGIDNAGNKRWVIGADNNYTGNPSIYTLINPTTLTLYDWTAVTTTLMKGGCFSVTFGRSSVSGNVFVAAGGVGSGTGNAIVTFDGTTATGYIPIPANNVPYQGSSVGYLNTGDATTSRFYATQLNKANKMLTSQYGSSWADISFNYYTAGNIINASIVSSIPY